MKKTALLKLFMLLCLLSLSVSIKADQLTDLITGKSDESAAVTEKVITTNNSAQDDRNIRKRLQEIFSELEELNKVKIVVSNGVVTLQGEVDSASVESKTLQFARQVEGVVEVENELIINRKIQTRLQNTGEKITLLGQQLLSGLPIFILAMLVLSLFWWIGGWMSDRQAFYRRITPNYFIATLLGQITHLIFIIIGIILALVLLDATALIGTILGAAGIVGLAVGFAVRDTVENYIASILLSLRNPFEVKDLVDIDGHVGHVARLTSRATILISPDGNHIRIPNSMVFKSVIVNFTRNPERRFDFEVGVDTDQDLLNVQALALDTLCKISGVMKEPKPSVMIDQLGDSNVLIRLYGWVDQENYSLVKVRSEAIRETKQAFDAANIVMPEPIYKLKVQDVQSFNFPQVLESQTLETSKVSEATHKASVTNTDAVRDISVDRTVENKVAEEQQLDGQENLLNSESPKEM
ncbi:MAG: MscS Mechanosensitive ion channel [uncultured Thiotrichaceae bacterium]|uniref:Small-conductance mechanosensitive channel n=1 Tax=uncultured Thiotrichaceae bacterium TaxID=298394 RepID=A0A6S6SH80_9GAMM|nr:MAG: MscS Mechanosensitive ion channel [uncultured Thiotrichaceae bacterium]